MGMIRLLDEKTINKIAAGEVVEKPASIVKELVENSIDAEASEISVEVKSGGISFIRVSDNGKGISGDDIEYAFLRHATSKIKSDSDLYSVTTLGFRGEALASIAAVSRVEMISKTRDNMTGYRINLEGGRILLKEDCGAPDGTIITVRDVFFNTPARLKFLKSESKEGMYITEVMENLAMSHTDISFKYRLNDKMIFSTRGDNSLKSVLLCIYGKETVKNIIEVNSSGEVATVRGYIGNNSISRGSRSSQSVFVNGRYVKNKTVTAAVETAYKSMLTINKYPFFAIEVLVNPEFVDVNVHPAKSEVKFQDEGLIFKAVYNTVKNALIPLSSIPDNNETKSSIFDNMPRVSYSQQKILLDGQSLTSIREDREEKPLDYINNKVSYNSPDKAGNNIVIKDKPQKDDDRSQNSLRESKFGPLSIIGQMHFTYIIAEGPEDLYLIDQHAAHERIYYEKYMSDFKNANIHSQSLLVPIIVNMSHSEKQVVLDDMNFFKQFGYDIEDFGGNSISLRSVPVIYGNPNPRDLFIEAVAVLQNNEGQRNNIIDRIIFSMACKSAVKAGDKLSYKEMAELIESLRFCENPYTCPHGRPTIIKMSVTDLEKKFKRIQ